MKLFWTLVSLLCGAHGTPWENVLDFTTCTHLMFVTSTIKPEEDSNTWSGKLVIDADLIDSDWNEELAAEWNRFCVYAKVDQLESIDKVIKFVQTLRADRRFLHASGPVVSYLEASAPWNIHRGFEILLERPNGNMVQFPIPCLESLRGQTVKMGYIVIWPYTIGLDKGVLDGVDVKILSALERKYSFTSILERFPRTLKTTLSNGTSIGVFPDMNTGKYVFGLGQLTITLDRYRNIDFGITLFSREVGFASSITKRVDAFNTLILPFGANIWLALSISVISMSALFLLLERVIGWNEKSDPFFSCVCQALAPLMNEALPDRMYYRNRWNARWIALTFWLPLTFFLSMAYESNLLATLTIVAKEKPINTPQDILDSGMPVHALHGTILSEALQFSPRLIYQTVYHQSVVAKKGLRFFGEDIAPQEEAVLAGKALKTTTYLDVVGDPNLRYLPENILVGSASWFLGKGSGLQSGLNQDFQRLLESGFLNQWETYYVLKKRHEHEQNWDRSKDDDRKKALTVPQFASVLLVFGIGLSLGVLSFIIELITWSLIDQCFQ